MRWSDLSPRQELGAETRVVSFILLALPTAVLGLLAARTGSLPVAVGAGVQGLFLLVFLRAHPVWRPPIGVSVVILYLVAVLWAWVPLRHSTDWASPLARGVLLLAGIGLFAVHDLFRTGAEPLRQANAWAKRIGSRRKWPAQLADCRTLPEVVGLRNAIRDDPTPALALLSDSRDEVKTAALGALEYRPHWREGEAELVLKVGWESEEPAVRAAAVYALAGVGTPELVAGLADFLRDPVVEVRRAAAEALMWDADARWPFARDGVREALADPLLCDEGPLFAGIGRLPAAAVADLITWSAEHPPLAGRAILTLVEHYHADLIAGERADLGSELAAMMLDNETSPALRVEIAALLREHFLLTPDLLDRLTNLDQPAPIRLFAAELMLRINPHDPDGVDVLRGLARQPNRELSVRVAAVLQTVLGLNMGLSNDFPPPQSKEAADITRRVLAWANGMSSQDVFRPTPAPLLGSRHSLPSIGSRHTMQGIPVAPATPRPAPSLLDESALVPDQSGIIVPSPPSTPAPEVISYPEEAPGEPEQQDVLAAEEDVMPPTEVTGATKDESPTPPGGRSPSPEESSLFPGGFANEPEESPHYPGASSRSVEESSLFSDHSEMPPGPMFPGAEPMSPDESSMLPHDEPRPKPPPLPPLQPPRRPGGSSAVI